jgi:hypothetical protein
MTQTGEPDERLKAAWDVMSESGPPRGHVVKILEEEGIDRGVIDRVATRLVPYTYT